MNAAAVMMPAVKEWPRVNRTVDSSGKATPRTVSVTKTTRPAISDVSRLPNA
jgi:hypothetical protein